MKIFFYAALLFIVLTLALAGLNVVLIFLTALHGWLIVAGGLVVIGAIAVLTIASCRFLGSRIIKTLHSKGLK